MAVTDLVQCIGVGTCGQTGVAGFVPDGTDGPWKFTGRLHPEKQYFGLVILVLLGEKVNFIAPFWLWKKSVEFEMCAKVPKWLVHISYKSEVIGCIAQIQVVHENGSGWWWWKITVGIQILLIDYSLSRRIKSGSMIQASVGLFLPPGYMHWQHSLWMDRCKKGIVWKMLSFVTPPGLLWFSSSNSNTSAEEIISFQS